MAFLTLGALLAGGIARAGEPSARPAPVQLDRLAGRYLAGKSGQIFDIARCGADWCAVRVTTGVCGDVAMRLVASVRPGGHVAASGHFDREPGTARHAVAGWLSPDPAAGGRVLLSLHGEPGDSLRYLRRVFPYAETFSRQGEGTCRTEDANS